MKGRTYTFRCRRKGALALQQPVPAQRLGSIGIGGGGTVAFHNATSPVIFATCEVKSVILSITALSVTLEFIYLCSSSSFSTSRCLRMSSSSLKTAQPSLSNLSASAHTRCFERCAGTLFHGFHGNDQSHFRCFDHQKYFGYHGKYFG